MGGDDRGSTDVYYSVSSNWKSASGTKMWQNYVSLLVFKRLESSCGEDIYSS